MKKLLLLCCLISTADAVPIGLVSSQTLDGVSIYVTCIGTTEYVVARLSSGTAITPH